VCGLEVSKKTLQEEIIETDVLVIGAGAGGLMAAIASADSGAKVILCEKGNTRRSGGIAGGNDHFWCYIPGFHSDTFKLNFIKELLNLGVVGEEQVTKFVDRSYEVVQMWESWGINMKIDSRYVFTGHSWPGSSGEPGKTDRYQLHFFDEKQCVKLEKQAKIRGVRIINRVMITELLKGSNGRVIGAIGISTREPKIYIIQSKCTIFNKGHVGNTRLYPSPNVIGYSMAEPATGDGVMAAYRIGADVQKAESFGRQVSLRFGPWAGKGTWIGVARDAEGKPIAPPFHSKPNRELGEKAIENSSAVDHVWAIGKGPVWMDPRGISDEDLQYMKQGWESEAMLHFLKWVDQEKIDVQNTRFEFLASQPGSGIQIKIDADYKTTIDGLYAIANGPLSVSAVGGLVAAESAAKDIKDIKISDLESQRNYIIQVKQGYEELLNREGSQYTDWKEAQWAIWQIMHCYSLPPHRTENTLTAGYNQLLRLRQLARKTLRASNPHDLYHCLEVLNLMDGAELVILAVRERKESKGNASRQDYPFPNPMLGNKSLVITQVDGKPSFRWENPRR
jgi:succinate dehydrogenase/fumarate reductase flavoprotein subunit